MWAGEGARAGVRQRWRRLARPWLAWSWRQAVLRLWGRREKTKAGVEKTREAWWGRLRRLLGQPGLEESLWAELEETLVLADVGLATTEKLLGRVRERARREGFTSNGQAIDALKEEMIRLLSVPHPAPKPSEGSPWVVMVVGVNGSGKTTSIAKLAHALQAEGRSVLLAAADTFRAAGIDQLKVWADRLGAEMVSHQPGADPGAVAYDALQAARQRGTGAVIIDTAGRLHTKANLMEELKKMKRVLGRLAPEAPHEVLLVMDATTGQNGLLQARAFTQALTVTGLFLAKLDGTAKGGIVLAIAGELDIPILYLGTGEKLDDLAPFDPRDFVEALLSPEE